MSETTIRCPSCGYSEADAGFHMDHRLCKDPDFFDRAQAAAPPPPSDEGGEAVSEEEVCGPPPNLHPKQKARPAPSKVTQQPFAWVCGGLFSTDRWARDYWEARGFLVTPLYIHPPSVAALQTPPPSPSVEGRVTVEEIRETLTRHLSVGWGTDSVGRTMTFVTARSLDRTAEQILKLIEERGR